MKYSKKIYLCCKRKPKLKLDKHHGVFDSYGILNEKALQFCPRLLQADNVYSYFHYNPDAKQVYSNGNKVYEVNRIYLQIDGIDGKNRDVVTGKLLVLVDRAEYMTHVLTMSDTPNLFYAKELLSPAPIGEEYRLRDRRLKPTLKVFNYDSGKIIYTAKQTESIYIKNGEIISVHMDNQK